MRVAEEGRFLDVARDAFEVFSLAVSRDGSIVAAARTTSLTLFRISADHSTCEGFDLHAAMPADGLYRSVPRRVDVAINEKRHIPDAVLGELQQGSLARCVAARAHFALVAGKALPHLD